MKKISIKHLHNLQNEALRGLDFYKEELTILQHRLEEITADNTGKEAMEQVEHFQNQLIIQKNNIDELRHAVNEHLSVLKAQLEQAPDFVLESSGNVDDLLYDRYQTLAKIINELRQEFNRFAAKWM